jgi:hypothetical protein
MCLICNPFSVPNAPLEYAGADAMAPQGKLMIQVNVCAGRHVGRRAQSFDVARRRYRLPEPGQMLRVRGSALPGSARS